MLPELVAYELTGAVVGERTNAGTTGLLDVATGTWASDLAEAVGVAPAILPAVEPAGRLLGEHRGVPVHLVAAHDTACAVAAIPLGPADRGFLSAGTWFLVGVERPDADTSEAARAANFSNEPGAVGGYRFLKNVPGFWLLERCAAEWGDTTARELLDLPGAGEQIGSVFDVREERFLAPERMVDEVQAAAGLAADAPREAVVSSIVRSIAAGRRVGRGRATVDPVAEGARNRRRRCRVARRQACRRRGSRHPARRGTGGGDGARQRAPAGSGARPVRDAGSRSSVGRRRRARRLTERARPDHAGTVAAWKHASSGSRSPP